MSNCESKFRTSYFHVKDMAKFKFWIKGILPNVELSPNGSGAANEGEDAPIAIISRDEGIPACDPTTDHDIDFPRDLAKHILPEEFVTIQEIGNDGMRYLWGTTVVIRGGSKRVISVYPRIATDLAARAFKVPRSEIPDAEY
jgi:hypothetical protein